MTTLQAPSPAIGRLSQMRASAWLRPQMIFAYVILGLWLVVLVAVQWIAPFDPLAASGVRLSPPSGEHLLGTDSLGRDVFSRTLYGARESLPIALAAIVGAVTIGCALGAIAGFFGGWVDATIMRFADITMAFPAILLAMAVAAALGPGLQNALIAIVAVWWPIYARLTRGQVLSIKQREHVEAATAIGSGRWRTLGKHILPHSATPIMVNATMDLGQIILLVASLSFLGLGALPPSPEWGAMVNGGRVYLVRAWWLTLAPGLAITMTAAALTVLGRRLGRVGAA